MYVHNIFSTYEKSPNGGKPSKLTQSRSPHDNYVSPKRQSMEFTTCDAGRKAYTVYLCLSHLWGKFGTTPAIPTTIKTLLL